MEKPQCQNLREIIVEMKIFIYGAGGHGRVVLDAMQLSSIVCTGFIDEKNISECAGLSVTQATDLIFDGNLSIHFAIGNCKVREKLVSQTNSVIFLNVTHPTSVVSSTSYVGKGTFLAAHAIVATNANVGAHCIVNHAAIIDHDCVVGDFCHIAPNATLGGGVKIGKGVLVGAGAVILPGVVVEDYAVIGAGSIVTKDVASNSTVVGNPARVLK